MFAGEGGITTIWEKSLGAVLKGGSAPLSDVVDYATPVVSRGLTFMETPGYDPVSATGMVAVEEISPWRVGAVL